MATLRCRLAQSHSGSRPGNRAQFLDSQSSVFHRDDGLRHHSKRAKPLSFHHFCCICWLGGRLPFWMSILPLSRGPKGWTHGKFVVRILLSFPEGPGILELLHFVGSVVAGGRHSNTLSLPLRTTPWPDCSATGAASYTDSVLPTELSQNRQSPQWRLEWAQFDFIACLTFIIYESISQLTIWKCIHTYAHVCNLICVVLQQLN